MTPRTVAAARLAGYSFLILFIELALIRYIAAYVRVFAFFVNFVLIATFLGMGVGLLRRDTVARWRWWTGVALVALFGTVKLLSVLTIRVAESHDEQLWALIPRAQHEVGIVPAVLVLFALVATLFVPLGAGLGRAFRRFPALTAYTLDVVGSLVGVLAFGALSALATPPVVWFAIAFTLWLVLAADSRVVLGAIGALGLVAWTADGAERWSPYYRITVARALNGLPCVYVNGMLHQCMIDFDHRAAMAEAYQRPYTTVPSVDTALVVGAGTGNDVAILLHRGARYIDAVEIDPVILSIGRRQHPLRPYADPRVHVHINDARAFLRTATRHYDVITMGTLDSQTLLSGMTSVRLDNYVYTVESLASAREHLKPGGSLIAYHMSPANYIGAKVFQLVATAFQQVPRTDINYPTLFNLTVVAGAGAARASLDSVPQLFLERVELPVDDWPYLYLRARTVPMHYLVALAGVLAIAALFIALAARGLPDARVGSSDAALFGTGLGFLLLESKSVTEMSLLFGATWAVNLLVFAAILLVIAIANVGVARLRRDALPAAFAGLLATLAVAYAVPAHALLAFAPGVQWALGGLLVALPVFFAALIFALLFRGHPEPTRALSVNLMGAIVGGLLEYAAMAAGIKALYLIAAVAYLGTLLAVLRTRRLPVAGGLHGEQLGVQAAVRDQLLVRTLLD